MQNNLKFLLAIMLVLLVSSYFVLSNKSNVAQFSTEMLIPELQDLINQVDAISIEKNEQTLTLTRQNNTWRLSEMDGFIADTNTVAALLIDLRKLTLKQQKTSNPDNYAKLALDTEGANAATKIILQRQGEIIADVSIGKKAPRSQGIYVRKNAEPQTWLAEGEVSVKTNGSDWILKTIIDIGPELIRSIKFKPADSEVFEVNRLTPQDNNFTLINLEESMQVISQTNIDALANGLQKMTIDGANKKVASEDQTLISTITYQFFSGSTFVLKLIEQGEQQLLTVEVDNNSVDSSLESELQNWQFALPEYKFNALNKKLSDLVEPIPTESQQE